MRRGDEPVLRCPACDDAELEPQRVRGKHTGREIELDRCPRCGGLWFDARELERVLDVAAKDLNVADDAKMSRRRCPVDEAWMFAFAYPQTWANVEMCRKCKGLWLDAEDLVEIEKVRRHLTRKDELDRYAPLTGLKGRIIRAINRSLEELMGGF